MDDGDHTPAYKLKRAAWREWHTANPHVWDRFVRMADEARAHRPGERTGHWLIIGKLRWEHWFTTTGPEFKLSNDHTAFYARAYMASRADRRGFFKIKRMIGEDWSDTCRKCGVPNGKL